MTPEQINIAIAEICGWQSGTWFSDCYSGHGWLSPGKTQADASASVGLIAWWPKELPNYSGSLDAMATAEATLTERHRELFPTFLDIVVVGSDNLDSDFAIAAETVFATAMQRAEAFLRLHGKWKGGA